MTPSPTGRVESLHIWPSAEEVPTPVQILQLDFSGPVGDRHAGLTMASDTRTSKIYAKDTEIRNHRQVSIVSLEELAAVAERLGIERLAPGVIADNIAVSGIPDLTALPRMTRMVFPSGAALMTGGVNTPCTLAGGMVQARYGPAAHRFPKAAYQLRGVTAWVDHPGNIAVGDTVRLHPPG